MTHWRVFVTPTGDRSSHKLPVKVKSFVLDEFPSQVSGNPLIGEPLHGPLSWLRSFHFTISGTPYRIAYEIDAKNQYIRIHYAGYRGDFYKRLHRALGI